MTPMSWGLVSIYGSWLDCAWLVSLNLGSECGVKTAADWVGCSNEGSDGLCAGVALVHGIDGWVLLHLRHLCAYTQ